MQSYIIRPASSRTTVENARVGDRPDREAAGRAGCRDRVSAIVLYGGAIVTTTASYLLTFSNYRQPRDVPANVLSISVLSYAGLRLSSAIDETANVLGAWLMSSVASEGRERTQRRHGDNAGARYGPHGRLGPSTVGTRLGAAAWAAGQLRPVARLSVNVDGATDG